MCFANTISIETISFAALLWLSAFAVVFSSRRLRDVPTDANMPVAMLAVFGYHGDTHVHTEEVL